MKNSPDWDCWKERIAKKKDKFEDIWGSQAGVFGSMRTNVEVEQGAKDETHRIEKKF